ncbi:hypothetical protein [Nostocoides sp. Soil756]|uniref:hypothetical protein n=1 Tax=Nostocoides sp. Soil756 TaxID=1736399 RepID=UPI0006FA525C|nr:hypothetical protein [Tetrasphaera sp. Soil756]KRE60781.1 hypothetical protein ASG78_10340 [Tetrasphaera sp. Soil756]
MEIVAKSVIVIVDRVILRGVDRVVRLAKKGEPSFEVQYRDLLTAAYPSHEIERLEAYSKALMGLYLFLLSILGLGVAVLGVEGLTGQIADVGAAGVAGLLVYLVLGHSLMRVDVSGDLVRCVRLGLPLLVESVLIVGLSLMVLIFLATLR